MLMHKATYVDKVLAVKMSKSVGVGDLLFSSQSLRTTGERGIIPKGFLCLIFTFKKFHSQKQMVKYLSFFRIIPIFWHQALGNIHRCCALCGILYFIEKNVVISGYYQACKKMHVFGCCKNLKILFQKIKFLNSLLYPIGSHPFQQNKNDILKS